MFVTLSLKLMFCENEHLVLPVDMLVGTLMVVVCPSTAAESSSASANRHMFMIIRS